MKLIGMDHIVLVVSDLQAAIEFYRDILDMRAEQRGVNTALLFGDCKIHLHEMQTGARPVAAVPAYGSQDFCVRAEGSIQEIYKELQKKKAPLEPEMGIVKRIGALGEMQSVYLRDPDGNLVEICVYSA